jgi:tetratricopeptide (TPR) repeat protein
VAKTTLAFKSSVPKLKYLKPDLTTIVLTFEVSGDDVNPLFLQELSDNVRSDYLVPLNSAWGDLWKKWDDDLDKLIPTLATKTEGARRKAVDIYVAPLDAEYKKQTDNIEKQAKAIGDKYWAEITRQRTELRDFRLLTGAKIAWKGLSLAANVGMIVTSGGTAVTSYIQALRKVYQIYGEFKKLTASVDDYQIKVYKDIESLKTSMWKLEGALRGYAKKQITAAQAIKEFEKYLDACESDLGQLKENLKIFDVKVGQFHLQAGDLSKKLDEALDKVDEALSLDPKLAEKHRSEIMSLILDVQRMSGESKKFQAFNAQAKKFVQTSEKTLKIEEDLVKDIKKAVKGGVVLVLKESAETVTRVSADFVAAKLMSKEALDWAGYIDNWGKKVDQGMKVVDVLLKVF